MIVKITMELPDHPKLTKTKVLIRDYAFHAVGIIVDWDFYEGNLWGIINRHFIEVF